jgi:hypothetical protein
MLIFLIHDLDFIPSQLKPGFETIPRKGNWYVTIHDTGCQKLAALR